MTQTKSPLNLFHPSLPSPSQQQMWTSPGQQQIQREQSLHEALDPLQKICDLFGAILEILSRINDEHLLSGIRLEPLLMLLMDQLEVIKGYLRFLRPHATLGPLVALLWGTLEVDDLGALYFRHLLETAVERLEHLMLSLVHISQVLHQLREDILVSKDTPLTNLDLIRVALGSLVQFLHSSEDGVDLEGKAPSLRLNVVLLQHVDLLSTQVLPLRDGFFDPSCLGHPLTHQLDDGRLTATNVALNREVELGQFGVHHTPLALYLGLIGISRQELHELNFKLPPKRDLITHADSNRKWRALTDQLKLDFYLQICEQGMKGAQLDDHWLSWLIA